ncbi:MAG: glycosyltransferase family 2 protein [Phycisphaeraceae bacterium]|nr:glycosyltransferase family 2 protein [Phycisphaeraceae bacterium]
MNEPLSIIIVNYRTPDLTRRCLESVARERDQLAGSPPVAAIVVDNGSGDDSVDQLTDWIRDRDASDWVTLIPSPENLGFSAGSNLGLQAAPDQGPVLLLNSDTELNDACLTTSLNAFNADPDIGLFSCRLVQPDGQTQITARPFPTPLRAIAAALGLPWLLPPLFRWAHPNDPSWDRDTDARDVDWLGGAFLLIRRSVIDTIGKLDEDFFFYGEDVEYCHRAAVAGYRRRYDPAATTLHHGGGSGPVIPNGDPENRPERWRARYLVQRKLYGRTAEILLRWTDRLTWAARHLRYRLTGQRDRAASAAATRRALRTCLGDQETNEP